jgi:hypothetical protein
VLVDVSGSMAGAMSGRSTAQCWELAALFGSALAARAAQADVVEFQSFATEVKVRPGASILRAVEDFRALVGGGTDTSAVVARGHLPSGTHQRYTFGGLTDRGFAAIALLERGRDVSWDDLFTTSTPATPAASTTDAPDDASDDGEADPDAG